MVRSECTCDSTRAENCNRRTTRPLAPQAEPVPTGHLKGLYLLFTVELRERFTGRRCRTQARTPGGGRTTASLSRCWAHRTSAASSSAKGPAATCKRVQKTLGFSRQGPRSRIGTTGQGFKSGGEAAEGSINARCAEWSNPIFDQVLAFFGTIFFRAMSGSGRVMRTGSSTRLSCASVSMAASRTSSGTVLPSLSARLATTAALR